MKKNYLKGFLYALFCLFCVLLPCTSSLAQEQTYTITETELTQLETNLKLLETHNKKKNELLREQNEQLQIALIQLETANEQIKILQASNEKTEKSLVKVNQHLNEYEKEIQAKIKSEKRQKHIWQLATAVFAIALIAK
ncbi:hypothetical protein [Dialister micraerophilus]|uniref:hypothetical protein n=1 Tax=Dialister micraerophilus TaxID=309120 RepID=UPI0023F40038|nr:hypothetical protein [Dialister micraerophilus]